MGNGPRRPRRRRRLPGLAGATWERDDGAALRREPAPARGALRRRRRRRPGQRRAAARQGDVLQQLRRRRRRAAGRVRLRPSRPSRSSSTPTRAASRSAPTSPRRTARRTPATRCPRTAASSRPTAPVTPTLAEQVAEIFTEVVVAPDFEPEALEILTRKKNIRLLGCPPARSAPPTRSSSGRSAAGCCCRPRQIDAEVDAGGDDPSTLDAGGRRRRRRRRPWPTCAFAWRAMPRGEVQRDPARRTTARRVGVGMGQVNRVDSCRLAVARAGRSGRAAPSPPPTRSSRSPTGSRCCSTPGSAPSSQPGGSIRDDEVVEAATAAGVTMYFTGTRHFPTDAAAARLGERSPPRRRASPAGVAARRAGEREPAQRSLA